VPTRRSLSANIGFLHSYGYNYRASDVNNIATRASEDAISDVLP
jgi:hypothetical protein